MKRARTMKITATRRRTIRLTPPAVRARCPVCEREVEMLTVTQAAEVLEIEALAFKQFIADGQVHAVETLSGGFRVCQDSLFVRRKRT
jgi:hypothetical protein